MTATVNWQDRINPVVRDIPPSGIRRFFDLATEMKGVVSLGVGEPDFVTPWQSGKHVSTPWRRATPCTHPTTRLLELERGDSPGSGGDLPGGL